MINDTLYKALVSGEVSISDSGTRQRHNVLEKFKEWYEENKKMNTLEERMQDLIKQATTEQSHYYTAKILVEALQNITDLKREIADRDDIINELEEFKWKYEELSK